MKVLDLFSADGDATKVFADEGHEVTYVDIVDGLDISDYVPERKYDFVWASPVCQEYSLMRSQYNRRIPDRTLWNHTFRVIDRAKRNRTTPWVIENVNGARFWWGNPVQQCCPWYFWGYFPHVDLPKGYSFQKDTNWNRYNAKERSRIPYEISKAFYTAIWNNGKAKVHKR